MAPSARRVLLVDEDPAGDPTVGEIAHALETAGFSVRVAVAGDSPTAMAARFRPDVAVISLKAADRSEEAIGTMVHTLQSDHGLPVVLVDAAAPAPDAPLSAAERLAAEPPDPERVTGSPVVDSITTMLSGSARTSSTLEAGDVVVDEAGRLALRADEPLDLTRMEFDLLAHFVRNRNRVLSREALLASVWRNVPVTPNAIEAVVSKLRAKLEEQGPRMIHTVRGIGYVLRVEGTSPFDIRRHRLLADRERIVRQRDEVLARREALRRERLRSNTPDEQD